MSSSSSSSGRRKKKKGGLDPEVKNKLLAESIAPWRTLRLFLYAGGGSGALLGGLITLTGVLAGLSGARTDLDLGTEVCVRVFIGDNRNCGWGFGVTLW